MTGLDLSHLKRQLFGMKNALLKKDVGEGSSPSLVISELADELRTKGLNAPPLFLGVNNFVKIKHVR
jgi:hypothetical protein